MRTTISLLYQSPPENLIKIKDHIVYIPGEEEFKKAPLKTFTHVAFGNIYQAKPGDIIFTDTEELMVVTTKLETVKGVGIMVAGCIKMNDL